MSIFLLTYLILEVHGLCSQSAEYAHIVPSLFLKRWLNFTVWSSSLMRKDLNILVCGPLKKVQIYSRFSKCTNVYHCCHSVSSSPTVLLQRGHTAKIAKRRCQLDLQRFFFTERVLDKWNSSHRSIIDSTSKNCFKNGLERTRATQMGFFTD